jgi:hypothetical protein
MNPVYTLLIIVGIVAAVVGGIYIVIPYAVKKGLNVSGVLETTTTVLNTVETALDGVQLLLPENPTLDLIDRIVDWAKKGAEAAEQMYKASLISKDERNQQAKDLVYECLSVANIERTEQIDSIVSGMIEAAVLALPKTDK